MTPTDRSGISRATFDRYPWMTGVRTPAGRVVAALALLIASALVVAGFARAAPLLAVLGLLAWIPAMAAVNVAAGGVTAMRRSELDERERERREGAQSVAHRITGGVLLVLVVGASLTLPVDLERDHVVAGLFGIFLLHLAAPSLVLASTTRPPDRH